MSASKLVRPSEDYRDSFIAALAEYHNEDRFRYWDMARLKRDFSSFVKDMNTERGVPHQPLQDWVEPVAETVTWLVKDEDYIGTAVIRHRLTWHLERWGGHIHFIIRPTKRGMDYGKKILMKAMPVANYLGVDQALLTIAPDNAAAIRIAEAAGARLQDELPETDQFPARLRYWLNCT